MTRLDTPFYTPLASGALQQLSETLWRQLCVRYPVPDVLGYILLQQLMVALWQARELGLEQAGQFAQQADPTSRPMLVLSRERRAECRHIAQLRRTLTEDTPPLPRTSNPDQKSSKPANTPTPENSKPVYNSATTAQKQSDSIHSSDSNNTKLSKLSNTSHAKISNPINSSKIRENSITPAQAHPPISTRTYDTIARQQRHLRGEIA